MSILMKNRNKNSFAVFMTAVLLFSAAAGFHPVRVSAQSESRAFTFSGDSTSISFSENDRRTLLTGSARITSEDLVISSAVIELFGDNFRYARCSGDVQVENAPQQITLSTESLFYDRETELVRIRDYVEMVDLKNEIVVKCGYLEYFNKTELSIFEIGVRILKSTEEGQMVCRSDFARYDRISDTLQLSGNPVVYWKGDRYSAISITINLENDEISLEGDVEGEFTAEKERQD